MTEGVYIDGQTAKDHTVAVRFEGNNLIFSGSEIATQSWTISGLHPIDRPTPDQPFRITHDEHLGQRLVLRDEAFVDELIAKQPALKGGVTSKQVFHVTGWIIGGFAFLAALGYLFLTFLPQNVAHMMPDTWRNKVGEQIENAVVDGVLPLMINAYSKGDQKKFLIEGSETPHSIPAWLRLVILLFIGWAMYYLIISLNMKL